MTSPVRSPLIGGIAAGLVLRGSERIIDCPVRTIVNGADCAETPMTIEHAVASRPGRAMRFMMASAATRYRKITAIFRQTGVRLPGSDLGQSETPDEGVFARHLS